MRKARTLVGRGENKGAGKPSNNCALMVITTTNEGIFVLSH